MIADQVHDFLKSGNIRNSVNYPTTFLEKNNHARIIVFNKNVSGIVSKASDILAGQNINIHGMINKSRGDFAYNIIDVDGEMSKETVKMIEDIPEVIRVRLIEN